jgi:hypothetical protein
MPTPYLTTGYQDIWVIFKSIPIYKASQDNERKGRRHDSGRIQWKSKSFEDTGK